MTFGSNDRATSQDIERSEPSNLTGMNGLRETKRLDWSIDALERSAVWIYTLEDNPEPTV